MIRIQCCAGIWEIINMAIGNQYFLKKLRIFSGLNDFLVNLFLVRNRSSMGISNIEFSCLTYMEYENVMANNDQNLTLFFSNASKKNKITRVMKKLETGLTAAEPFIMISKGIRANTRDV